jgi:hypothetical protein
MLQGTELQFNFKSNGDGSFSWVVPTDTNTVYVHLTTQEKQHQQETTITLVNAAVIGKVLTGYISGAGTVAATDTILQAIQKLNGNNATNANWPYYICR